MIRRSTRKRIAIDYYQNHSHDPNNNNNGIVESSKKRRKKKSFPMVPKNTPPTTKTNNTSSKSTVTISSTNLRQTIAPDNPWIDLNIPPEEFRPSATLMTGQCFSWMVVSTKDTQHNNNDKPESAWGRHDETEWIGPLSSRSSHYVISIKETPTTTMYRVLYSSNNDNDEKEQVNKVLYNYFQLQIPLQPLYNGWSQNCKRCCQIAKVIPGVRILRQEPLECLFSFLCSSNNNIPRITQLVTKLRQNYGTPLLDIPIISDSNNNKSSTKKTIYSFPTLSSLQNNATEEQLRQLGFGYRANYIIQTRDVILQKGGLEYLYNLRTRPMEEVQHELCQFTGVGRKVADCVALFSLDKINAIPVDVHVQRMAIRDYHFTATQKSLTPTVYQQVGDLFRQIFPNHAGWAHSLLFVAELPSFRTALPLDILQSMNQWKQKEQQQTKKTVTKKKKAIK